MEEQKKLCTICGQPLIDVTTHDNLERQYLCRNGHRHIDLIEAVAKMNQYPMASVLTPTRNRRKYIPRLIDQYLAQDWPNAELIIVDGGDDPIADLIPPEVHIRYFPFATTHPNAASRIGAALNYAIQQARGEYCFRFDDDDLQATERITKQMAIFELSGKSVVAGSSGLFMSEATGKVYEYTGSAHSCSGFSHAFRRDYALAHPYSESLVGEEGEDIEFTRDALERGELCTVSGCDWLVARMHSDSTCGPRFDGPGQGPDDPIFQTIAGNFIINLLKTDEWRLVPRSRVAHIIGTDMAQANS